MKLDDSWCPGLTPIERVARFILHKRVPEMRFDMALEEDARRALAETQPGHSLPAVMMSREILLHAETERVAVVLEQLIKLIELVSLEIAVSS